ncbi:type II CAAX prenyl endopeptidase Rce1 family protein [Altererythrobacter aquiaggeris]|uniref:CPBP family glutamic-type intramembrane protease n=1 Tax=Aestuarierythrobacter aquiaggeris TaxID=1898396 RepID=UPI0030165097
MRAPRLPQKINAFSTRVVAGVWWMFVLDLVLMCVLLAAALTIFSFGVDIPANKLDSLTLDPQILFVIIIAAPVFEEILFRSWLSGRPALITIMLILGAFALGLATIAGASGLDNRWIFAIGGVAAIIAATFAGLHLRGRAPFRFFTRHFGWFYALSTGLFAVAHLGNYDNANPVFLLLVIPQAVAGLVFGYTRIHYGLWASMLVHALHNGTFIAFAMLGKSAA